MSKSAVEERAAWKDDRHSSGCENCSKAFSLFVRRHHCRQCGGVFCSSCCFDKVRGVPGYGDEPQRVCVRCKEAAFVPADAPRNVRPRTRKICVLGVASVGKTAMVQQFVMRTFPEAYTATIHDRFSKQMSLRGGDYNLVLFDTAGQTTMDLFQPSYSIGTHAFILVYAIDDRPSFLALGVIRDRILECGGHNVAMMLVGNKADLSEGRVVSEAEAKALAALWKVPHMEVSAKRPKLVDAMFAQVLQLVVDRTEQ